jgi:serine/threonine-protein kinase HipA
VAARTALDVLASGRMAGLLDRSDLEADSFLFTYRGDCRAEDAVSLTMPLIRDPYDSMGTVHPIFEMNLPEGALLEKLRMRFAKTVPDFDSLALLAIVGRSQIGRLRYALTGESPEDVPAEDLAQLLAYRGAHDLFADLLERYATASGISGMQPKVLVRTAEPDLPRITHRGATHIVKSFDSREYPELAANEYFCLHAARRSGLPTAMARLAENRRVLVLDRFDRREDGTYLGCEDFCVLSGLRSHGRYHGAYEDIATRIAQFVSGAQQGAALAQLFATVALCCAVENGDAHLKNFAVLYEHPEGLVQLAPVYDIIATTPYSARDVLALTLGGSKAFPDRARLSDFGRRACGLSKSQVDEALARVRSGVEGTCADMKQYILEHSDFARAGEHLIATFDRGLQRSIAIKPKP